MLPYGVLPSCKARSNVTFYRIQTFRGYWTHPTFCGTSTRVNQPTREANHPFASSTELRQPKVYLHFPIRHNSIVLRQTDSVNKLFSQRELCSDVQMDKRNIWLKLLEQILWYSQKLESGCQSKFMYGLYTFVDVDKKYDSLRHDVKKLDFVRWCGIRSLRPTSGVRWTGVRDTVSDIPGR